jgi:hypothetical protein
MFDDDNLSGVTKITFGFEIITHTHHSRYHVVNLSAREGVTIALLEPE